MSVKVPAKRTLIQVALLVATFSLYGLRAVAVPVRVTLDWPAGRPTSLPVPIQIEAIRNVGAAENAVPIEVKAESDGTVLQLAEGVWHLQASVPGYWSQGAEVVVRRGVSAGIQLTFWPAAFLYGEIATAEGESVPQVVDVRLSATSAFASASTSSNSPGLRNEPSPAHAELHCRVEIGTWKCYGPAGSFDMRLEAAGYAPLYEWGVHINAGQNNHLSRSELRRVPSVFGQAVRNDGSGPLGPCQAHLRAGVERQSPADTQSVRGAATNVAVPVSQRGYFQVVGVSPGTYLLSVVCRGASAFRDIRVQETGETRIDPPLLLQELALDIRVSPKTDPQGRPWQLTIDQTAPQFLRIAKMVSTSADGRWTRSGLTAGDYRVVVSSSDGTSWLQRYFDLGPRSEPMSLQLASLDVEGRVRLNSTPVRARLLFFNDAGGQKAALTSDNDGHFQGVLPVAPGVQETSWTIETHVYKPPVRQRLLGVSVHPSDGGAKAWLDLELPTIAVYGTVVAADGRPQPGAQVTFEDSKGITTTTSTDGAGNFQEPDLRAGKYTAIAESVEGVSDRTPFEVAEGSGSNLKLVLNASQLDSFYVVSSDGPIADAAVQVWTAPGVPRAFERTDEAGRFAVKLPPGTKEVALTVGAPGYAVKLTRLRIPSDADDSPDARTITLDASGGKLVLNFQQPGRTDDSFQPLYLFHNGGVQDARVIAGWGSDQPTNVKGPAVVDSIEPGKYSLCRINPDDVVMLWQGQLPSDRCRTGSLDADGTLTLVAP